jgi:glutamate-1-semialdehyde 2,1-aminomutase
MEFEIGSYDCIFNFDYADTTYLGTYNDPESFEKILAEHGSEIAAVFVEPIMGAGGIISATPEFLARTRAAAHAAGALFVCDEVVTYRMSTGGVQEILGLEPDITMLGKLIGGGFPVGAIAGKKEYLSIFDPESPKSSHSGTFAGNPVTMAAGVVATRELTKERIEHMASLCERLDASVIASARKVGLPISVNRSGSLMNLFFQDQAPRAVQERDDARAMSRFYMAALNHGVLMAPRGCIALSTVMDEALIDEAGERVAAAMADVADELN